MIANVLKGTTFRRRRRRRRRNGYQAIFKRTTRWNHLRKQVTQRNHFHETLIMLRFKPGFHGRKENVLTYLPSVMIIFFSHSFFSCRFKKYFFLFYVECNLKLLKIWFKIFAFHSSRFENILLCIFFFRDLLDFFIQLSFQSVIFCRHFLLLLFIYTSISFFPS